MNAKPLIFTILGYGAYKLASKGWAAARLNYYLDKITFKVDGTALLVFIHVAIQNATNASLQIRSFTGTMYVNETEMSNISSFNATNINSNSQTIFIITARVSMLGVGMELLNILQTGLQAEIKVDGTINVNGVSLPVSLKRNLLR